MQKKIELDAIPISIRTGKTINLSKIYLENEFNLGDRCLSLYMIRSLLTEMCIHDRGVIELMKCLQHNTTIKILSLKDCNLGSRAAKACARE